MAPEWLEFREMTASLSEQSVNRPVLQVIYHPGTNLEPLSSLSASHRSSDPFSKAPAITPREFSSDSVHARSLKLSQRDWSVFRTLLHQQDR